MGSYIWEECFKKCTPKGNRHLLGFPLEELVNLGGSGQLVASVLEDSNGIGACVAKMYSKHQYICDYINKYCRCV